MCSSDFTSLSGFLQGGIALECEGGASELLKSQFECCRPFGGERCSGIGSPLMSPLPEISFPACGAMRESHVEVYGPSRERVYDDKASCFQVSKPEGSV